MEAFSIAAPGTGLPVLSSVILPSIVSRARAGRLRRRHKVIDKQRFSSLFFGVVIGSLFCNRFETGQSQIKNWSTKNWLTKCRVYPTATKFIVD
jgi:hypothetical protein